MLKSTFFSGSKLKYLVTIFLELYIMSHELYTNSFLYLKEKDHYPY